MPRKKKSVRFRVARQPRQKAISKKPSSKQIVNIYVSGDKSIPQYQQYQLQPITQQYQPQQIQQPYQPPQFATPIRNASVAEPQPIQQESSSSSLPQFQPTFPHEEAIKQKQKQYGQEEQEFLAKQQRELEKYSLERPVLTRQPSLEELYSQLQSSFPPYAPPLESSSFPFTETTAIPYREATALPFKEAPSRKKKEEPPSPSFYPAPEVGVPMSKEQADYNFKGISKEEKKLLQENGYIFPKGWRR